MASTTPRAVLMALSISTPIMVLVIAGRLAGSDTIAHATAFIALISGLPWVVPAFVVVAVFSSPLFVALHVVGHPQDLAAWLTGVILTASVVACHINATLLFARFTHKRGRALEAGLADFLFRPARLG